MDFGLVVICTMCGIALCVAAGYFAGVQAQAATEQGLRFELSSAHRDIGNLNSDLDRHAENILSMRETARRGQKELDSRSARIAALEADKKHLEDLVAKLDQTIEEADSECFEAKHNLEEYAAKLAELESKNSQQAATIERRTESWNSSVMREEELKKNIAELNDVIQKKSQRCDELEQKLNSEYTDRRFYQDRNSQLASTVLHLNKTVEELGDKLAERDAVIKGLQAGAPVIYCSITATDCEFMVDWSFAAAQPQEASDDTAT